MIVIFVECLNMEKFSALKASHCKVIHTIIVR